MFVIQWLEERLSSSQLTFWENFIIWMNVSGAALAAVMNYKASKTGILGLRRTHYIISGFCVVYILGYLCLLIGEWTILSWSSFFRGVSVFTWVIVWAWPAIVSIRIRKMFEGLLADSEVVEDD